MITVTVTDPTVDELQTVLTTLGLYSDVSVDGTLTFVARHLTGGDDQVDVDVPRPVDMPVVDPPRREPRRTVTPPARRPRVSDDQLRDACTHIDVTRPVGPQLRALLGLADGSIHRVMSRAYAQGWLLTRMPDEPITPLAPRRPIDMDATRIRAAGAI